jgi:hypothetical protein
LAVCERFVVGNFSAFVRDAAFATRMLCLPGRK